ncbi:hypothetical protein GMOD_00003990 [Pyrenophora seminiperda CCB06]|uniref:Uncharacterized protein n=1 Tax=Pyrenophora seminiperda CCB06 TaxID=1302712 RepID=A0A3M7M0C9_9PLEO|nr:hypothetical protein GMOD_00003990 [Pyrenophora seminiperda CCB06]
MANGCLKSFVGCRFHSRVRGVFWHNRQAICDPMNKPLPWVIEMSRLLLRRTVVLTSGSIRASSHSKHDSLWQGFRGVNIDLRNPRSVKQGHATPVSTAISTELLEFLVRQSAFVYPSFRNNVTGCETLNTAGPAWGHAICCELLRIAAICCCNLVNYQRLVQYFPATVPSRRVLQDHGHRMVHGPCCDEKQPRGTSPLYSPNTQSLHRASHSMACFSGCVFEACPSLELGMYLIVAQQSLPLHHFDTRHRLQATAAMPHLPGNIGAFTI